MYTIHIDQIAMLSIITFLTVLLAFLIFSPLRDPKRLQTYVEVHTDHDINSDPGNDHETEKDHETENAHETEAGDRACDRQITDEPRKRDTYRVECVPIDDSVHNLQFALENHFGPGSVIGIQSLHEDLSGRYQVGTVVFDNVPTKLRLSMDIGKGGASPLYLDNNFYEFTVLYAPPEHHHKIDVIIVHGLGGHAFGSFKEKRGEEHMWPRDSLPEMLTDKSGTHSIARIIIYGYESKVEDSRSWQNIQDIARSFKSSLMNIASRSRPKPIIFIGHSMGGLVIKETLLSLSEQDDESEKILFKSARGIVFMGVPHAGMETASIENMATGNPNFGLVQSLSRKNSYFLDRQQRDFTKLLNDKATHQIDLVFFYETEESPEAQQTNGKWKMDGPWELLVAPSSAVLGGHTGNSYPIKCSHSEMVKFGPRDIGLKQIRGPLRDLASKVLAGLENERQSKILESESQAKQTLKECCESLGLGGTNTYRRSDELQRIRLEGTCEWLLMAPEFVQWVQGPATHDRNDKTNPDAASVLLLEGKPGSGKSVAMRAALEHCTVTDSNKSDQRIVLGVFFDKRLSGSEHLETVEYERSEAGMYGGLLLQLTNQLVRQLIKKHDPRIIAKAKSEILKYRKSGHVWYLQEIQEAILHVLGCLWHQDLFIFIDALEECVDLKINDLFKFIYEIERVGKGKPLRLCLSVSTTSHLKFSAEPEFPKNRALIDVSKNNKSDIQRYLRQRLSSLQDYRPRIFEKLVATISSRAASVFLWAQLVVSHILNDGFHGRPEQELLDYIEYIPEELKGLYRYLLDRIRKNDRTEACDLFLLLQVAKTPLTSEEVKSALECSKGSERKPFHLSDDDIEDRLKNLFFGLVECWHPNNGASRMVRFVHKSFGDFLVQDAGLSTLDQRFAKNPQAQYHLSTLQLSLRTIDYEMNSEDTGEKLSFLPYAAQFWMTHARHGDACISEDFKYPDFLDECDNYEAEKIVELWKKFDRYESYKYFIKTEEVPNTSWLKQENRLIVFLAFEGCTKLISQHLTTCQGCSSPLSTTTGAGSLDLEKAFLMAAERGFISTVETILDYATSKGIVIDIDSTTYGNKTPLYSACLKGQPEMVKLLLSRGADVLKSLEQCYEFPWHAAIAHEDTSVVDVILKHKRRDRSEIGRLLSAKGNANATVFHRVVVEGRTRVLEKLLHEVKNEVGVEALGARDGRGNTAYQFARHLKHSLEKTGALHGLAADAKTLEHALKVLGKVMRENNMHVD